jgi:hypothetical protein
MSSRIRSLVALSLLLIPAATQAQDATVTPSAVPTISPDEICAETGGIFREYWNDIPGSAITDLTGSPDYPASPTGAGVFIRFDGTHGFDDYENYGERYRGYLCPPADGRYTFWIAGDDVAELYLSTDTNPANKTRIAAAPKGTSYQEWDTDPLQQSLPITLKAGQPYYIEALHKQGTGGYNLSVAWEGPAFEQQVIGGEYLSPAGFVQEPGSESIAICAETAGIYREYWNDIPGSTLKDLRDHPSYPGSPSGAGTLLIFDAAHGFMDYENYGERYRGYLCPPSDGGYTFWIAADDIAELYLSTDTNPANKTLIASVSKYTDYQDWTASPSQKSVVIRLKGGRAYYIEALHKQGTGGYNFSVAWEGPGIEQQIIAGVYLSTYGLDNTARTATPTPAP